MSNRLPDAFVNRMREQLGSELSAFLHALEEPSVRGIRLNPLKKTDAAVSYTSAEAIPWTMNGYYLAQESDAGRSLLHEAGAWYIQEPCAMIPAEVLNAQPGEYILDLCAAPGGKSTQIGLAMKGKGLLVCNEPVPRRALILSRNIERMGIPNTVVTCVLPELLAGKWPEGFDAVMVDAPCSGEGMFRRDPDTRNEWTAEKAAGCAERQRDILSAAAGLVRPGGRLIYSTCTYNPEENNHNAEWFVSRFPEFRAEAFSLPGVCAPDGEYTCYPHHMKGEGQYIAKFRKAGNKAAVLPGNRSLTAPSKAQKDTLCNTFPMFPPATHILGNTLAALADLPDLGGVRVIRAGLHLGEVRGRIAVPDHAAALCIRTPAIRTIDLSSGQALRYAAGETIPGNSEGWLLMRYKGLAIGWGKGSQGIIKNHYPKGLRSIRYTL